MAEGSESPGSLMKITVKTPKEKHDLEINVDATVEELKEKVSAKFSAPREQLCLIFAGKILKDADKLSQHGIKNGLTVHLVIKSANRAQEQAAQHSTTSPQSTPTTGNVGGTPGVSPPQPDVGATPFGLGSLGGLAGMGGMGMGSANFMEMQQRMQRELMSNPEMMRQMMENPLVQSMMSNPDVMRQLIMNNPQMRELMERNPEITHMLNNPELMRQTMELARNPAMLQELMRSQDRAMSNLESIPGGFNALQRMYRDIQEPMMNAAQESLGGSNPFAGLVSSSGDSGSQQQGRENSDPLPNPWAPPGSTTTTSTSTSTSGSTPTSSAPGTGQSGAQAAFGMFNTPGMQSLMQQVVQNPQMMQNMMQAPYVQTMLQTMAANPELAQQMFQNNPMFAGNQQMQELFLQSLPQMSAQLQNPEVQSMVSNPRALNAVMQIQQGLATLQQEAPNLFPRMAGLAGGPPTAATTPPGGTTTTTSSTAASPATATPTATPTNTTTTTTTTATGTVPTPSAGGVPTGPLGTTMGAGPDAFTNMMAQMMQMMVGAQGNPGAANPGANLLSQPPETRYAGQLEQLAAMGFVDREANIRALTATLGDVNAAIDRLLSQR